MRKLLHMSSQNTPGKSLKIAFRDLRLVNARLLALTSNIIIIITYDVNGFRFSGIVDLLDWWILCAQ